MIQATLSKNLNVIKKVDLGVASYLAAITMSTRNQYRIPLALYRLNRAADIDTIALYADLPHRVVYNWVSWYKRRGVVASLRIKGKKVVYYFTDPLIYTFIAGVYTAYEKTMKQMEEEMNANK